MSRRMTVAKNKRLGVWAFYCPAHRFYRTDRSFRTIWAVANGHMSEGHSGLSAAEQAEWDRALDILSESMRPASSDSVDYMSGPAYPHRFDPRPLWTNLCLTCGGERGWTLDGSPVHPEEAQHDA